MKNSFKVFVAVFIILVSINANAQWVPSSTGMGNDKSIFSLLSLGFVDFFAGTAYYGVYRSTNVGVGWVQSGLSDKTVYSLALSGSNLVAGTNLYGVWLSPNNGSTWSQTSLSYETVRSLAVSGSYIFAGTAWGTPPGTGGVYRSPDNGSTWLKVGLDEKTVYALAFSGSTLYAATRGYGVWQSFNNGTTWSQTGLTNQIVYSLAVSGNNIYAGTECNGVYYSSNSGSNWSQVGLNGKIIYTLLLNSGKIFAGCLKCGAGVYGAGADGSGIFLSTDNGITWIEKNQGFTLDMTFYSLAIANTFLFAGSFAQSVWKRTYSEIIGIKQISELVPVSYLLHQNYPNPFNPSTNIRYELPRAGNVKLVIFNTLGQEVQTLVNETQSAGIYEALWNASGFPGGVYFYRLTAGGFGETRKMLLVR